MFLAPFSSSSVTAEQAERLPVLALLILTAFRRSCSGNCRGRVMCDARCCTRANQLPFADESASLSGRIQTKRVLCSNDERCCFEVPVSNAGSGPCLGLETANDCKYCCGMMRCCRWAGPLLCFRTVDLPQRGQAREGRYKSEAGLLYGLGAVERDVIIGYVLTCSAQVRRRSGPSIVWRSRQIGPG